MALQVWLPLNGNLNNQGLANVSVTNSGATVNSAGKIGNCYAFTESQYMVLNNIPFSQLGNCSVCFWIYLASNESWLPCTGGSAGSNTGQYFLATEGGTGAFYHSNIGSNTKTIYRDGVVGTAPLASGAWHHYCITGLDLSSWSGLTINHYGTYSGWNFNGRLNDFRIYDHCLSPKEVKEVSKGLVLHYKLDDPYVEPTTNLITGISSVARCTIEGNGVRVAWNVTSGDTYLFFNTSEGMVQGTTYTLSFDVEGLNESGVSFAWSNITGGDNRYLCVLHNGHNVKTFTHNSSESRTFFDDIHRNNTSNFWMGNFQLEKKDHATPYTPSTRSGVPVYDYSGYGYNGSSIGTISTSSDTSRYRMCYNVSNGNAVTTSSIPFAALTNCTISAWVYVQTNGTSGWVLFSGQTTQHYIFATSNGTGAFYHDNVGSNTKTIYRDGVVGTTPLSSGAWHHYCITGIDLSGWTKFGVDDYYYTFATNWNFTGKVSDVRIYNTALSADDIKELYDTSTIIYNDGTVAAREAIETNNDNVDITKTGIISTQRFIECKDYLYLPAGNGVTTDLYYDNGDTCTAETIIRYESSGSGRDLMGFSPSANGYWGVSSSGYWEIYGSSSSYTDSDITKLNRIFYQYTAQTSVAGDHGYYQIGRLADSYSVRTKYVYNVKLYKNGVLERDLYPASNGTVAGLMDALHGTFYVATGTGSGRSSLGNDEAPTARFYKDHIQLNQIIEI